MDFRVTGRSLNCEYLVLGVQGDNRVEKYRFILDRYTTAEADLSSGLAYAVYELSDGQQGYALLDVETNVDTIVVSLVVGSEMTVQPGKIKLGLKISGLDDQLWSSELSTVTVKKSIPMPSPQPFMVMAANEAIQPMSLVGADTLAPYPKPITVTERTMIIPPELQTVAVALDEASMLVRIVVPRLWNEQDLSEFDFRLHTESAGEGVDDIIFNDTLGNNKIINANTVDLIWVLRSPQTAYAGKLSIQLLIEGIDFKWHTLISQMTIAPHLEGEPVIPLVPTIFEQMIQEMLRLRDQGAMSADRAEAAADSADKSAKAARASELAAYQSELAAKKSETEAKLSELAAEEAANRAEFQADRAENEADRAELEADRAASFTLDLGFFNTSAELNAAHPAPKPNSYARVKETQTFWEFTDTWNDTGSRYNVEFNPEAYILQDLSTAESYRLIVKNATLVLDKISAGFGLPYLVLKDKLTDATFKLYMNDSVLTMKEVFYG